MIEENLKKKIGRLREELAILKDRKNAIENHRELMYWDRRKNEPVLRDGISVAQASDLMDLQLQISDRENVLSIIDELLTKIL